MEVLRDQEISKMVLPARDIADDLVHGYWKFSQPLVPVLHQPTFMSRYESIWTGNLYAHGSGKEESLSQNIFYVTLNVVFAIGCQYTKLVKPERRSQYGDEFYQRSRTLINFEILDGVQEATIQMLLLTGVYLFYEQPSKYADRCWNVIGLAIRAAQGLGLHLRDPKEQVATQIDRELRRRIWYSSILMDR